MLRRLFLLLLVPLTAAAQCWVYQKSGVGVALHGVAVLDSLHRVAAGDDGTLLRTSDGGATWTRLLTNTSNDLTGISFATPLYGLAVGSSGTIFRTTDGGVTWTKKLNATLAWLTAVTFPDTLHAVAVGDWIETAILRSADGGKTWVQTDIPWINAMAAVSFADSDNGMLAGDARIASTTDGGLNWNIVSEDITFQGVSMPSIENAAMVGAGTIYTSTDGLLTLHPDSAGAGYILNGVCYTGRDTGYIVGHGFSGGEWGGIVLHTSNGGAGWDTTFVPGTYLRAVHQTPGGQVTAVGDNGTIISLTAACTAPAAPLLLAPADGDTNVPLLTSETLQGAAALSWSYPALVSLRGSQVEIGTDTLFGAGTVHDTLVGLGASQVQLRLQAGGLAGGTTYYWRVRMSFRDGTFSGWSPAARFTTAAGVLRGAVFNDLNGNAARDAGEPALSGWRVDVAGTIQTSLLTDGQGNFVLRGLEAGQYRITSVAPTRWVRTCGPDTAAQVIGQGDSLDLPAFGFQYQKNSAGGTVFNDRNENGIRDAGEEGLPGWTLKIDGTSLDSAVTDASGAFLLDDLAPGGHALTLVPRSGWEQLAPVLGRGYSLTFSGYGTRLDTLDFSTHEIPPRVKNRFWISDSTHVNGRYVWWGVRPSTGDGIWGVDPAATISDFAEGEFDLPPPTFGVFDARFVQPPGSDALYANGSWTDMQAYTSPAQVDTYEVAFQPGYLFSGGYPMTLRWNKNDIAAGYTGTVELVGDSAGTVDMKATDSLIVTDASVGSLLLIAGGPKIPTVGVAGGGGALPVSYELEQNYPNPFNPGTVIRYSLPVASDVVLGIYDLLGRRIATLVDGLRDPGRQQVEWNAADDGGRPVAGGIYFCRLHAAPREPGRTAFTAIRKILYVK